MSKMLIRVVWFLCSFILLHASENVTRELPSAVSCNMAACQLPNCRCSGIPLPQMKFLNNESQIPQFVTVTFDDAVTKLNYEIYKEIFHHLNTESGCAARATFFVTHEYTDYSKVHALAKAGHEIALHSVTHGTGTEYWQQATEDTLEKEFGDQIKMLEKFALIPRENIHGLRMPFLQLVGNASFSVAQRLGLKYDASWPTQMQPSLWPYTLDYQSVQDCQIGVCPTANISGFWVSPMNSWTDMEGYSCAMLDSCVYQPKANDEDALVDWMFDNFRNHYEGNRAPFGMFLHAAWFERGAKNLSAFRRFLKKIIKLPNVYLTTMSDMLNYVQKPVLGEPNLTCKKKVHLRECKQKTCALRKVTTGEMRYMSVCGRCPAIYPWLDNPLGKYTFKQF